MSNSPNSSGQRLLNIHAVVPRSRANGPGLRAVVWTQGCRRRCPGCYNPLTHPHEPHYLMAPDRLGELILAIPEIEGLTVSGGEPFEQAEAVAALCRTVRQGDLSVMVFAGWTYEETLRSEDPAVEELLGEIDILVDGPFKQALAEPDLLWRGSTNQQVRLLTDHYGPDVLIRHEAPEVEGCMNLGQSIGITGFPDRVDLASLATHLTREQGITLEHCPPLAEP